MRFAIRIALTCLMSAVLAVAASPPTVNTQKKTSTTTKGPLTGEQIKWQVISSGGNRAASTNYVLTGTVGQTAVGIGGSPNYRLNQGFWQNFGSASCCSTPTTGDVDASGSVDISDLSAMVDYLFRSLPFPGSCFQEQDVDRSGSVDISDLSALVDYLFSSASLPACL